MADDQHGVRVALQIVLQPERAFEIEIVRRLVEQQDVGLRQTGSRRAPRACASRRRTPEQARRCASSSKPRPDRMRAARAGAECASMSVSRVWISAMRCGSVACSASASRLARSVSAESTQSSRLSSSARRLLRNMAEPRIARNGDRTIVGSDLPFRRRSSVVLPAPLRPTSPTLWPDGIAAVAEFEDRPAFDTIGEIIDVQHAMPIARPAAAVTGSERNAEARQQSRHQKIGREGQRRSDQEAQPEIDAAAEQHRQSDETVRARAARTRRC